VSRRRSSHTTGFKRWLSKLAKAFGIVVLVWLLGVVGLRFLSPPGTPLMAIRAVEYWLHGKEAIRGWQWRELSQIPKHVQRAVVAAEDARYAEHWGIDLSAVEDALEEGGGRKRLRGASTITMQTVKNIFLWPGRSYVRKFLEAGMAIVAGAVWGKHRTLELYLNVIEWGEGVYGIEAAAQHHYSKGVASLSASEAAALAAILPAPRTSSPRERSGLVKRRYLRIMREAHTVRLPN